MPYKNVVKVKTSDTRGSGGQTMTQENTPLSRDDDFMPPEKDPGRMLTKMKRLKGSTQPLGSKVTTAPSHG
jgi:hypothetical protein